MLRVIYLQLGAIALTVIVLGLLFGTTGALSAALAGVSCILPNAWFALRLKATAKRPGTSGPVQFFIGELIKVMATLGLLAVAIKLYPEMHWPSLLIGMLVIVQVSFFAFWKKS